MAHDPYQELRDTATEVLQSRDEIIHLQAEAIQGLVSLIVRHKGVDDPEFDPIKEKIDRAAMLRAEHDL